MSELSLGERRTTTDAVSIDYVNWRGERRVRSVVVREFVFGTMPPWHPAPCWMIRATDVELGEDRMFAMSGLVGWSE